MTIFGISDTKFNPDPKNKRIEVKRGTVAWKKLVEQLFIRDGFRCAYCKKIFPAKELAPCHIKSVGAGGSDILLNLKTACKNCHSKEHAGNFIKKPMKTYKIFD